MSTGGCSTPRLTCSAGRPNSHRLSGAARPSAGFGWQMVPIDDAGLDQAAIAAVITALDADPALAAELAQIDAALSPDAGVRFWRALAAELPRQARPAAAVLAALEQAAPAR